MDICANTQIALPLAYTWSDDEIEEFLRCANIINAITEHGFRKAATERFRQIGYRLATISRDFEPFDYIFKLSLYAFGEQPRLSRRDANQMARSVLEEIGLRPKSNEYHAEMSGRRLVVSVALPRWAWPHM